MSNRDDWDSDDYLDNGREGEDLASFRYEEDPHYDLDDSENDPYKDDGRHYESDPFRGDGSYPHGGDKHVYPSRRESFSDVFPKVVFYITLAFIGIAVVRGVIGLAGTLF